MAKRHSQRFREQAVQKALTRDGKSIKAIAQELTIGYSTLQKWIQAYQSMTVNKNNQRPQDWSRQQQFKALVDTAPMDAEQCSQYCRKQGIFPHHLDEWRDSFLLTDAPLTKTNKKSHQSGISQLKKENVALQKELRRKEKALAETAALLVLQKKFQALLEGKDE